MKNYQSKKHMVMERCSMIELKFEYQFTINEYFFKTKLIAVLLNHNHGIYFGILSQSQSRNLENFQSGQI